MTRRKVFLPALLAAFAACVAALPVSEGAEATFPRANGKIAFAAETCDPLYGCDGDSEIFTLRAGGGLPRTGSSTTPPASRPTAGGSRSRAVWRQ